MFYRIKNHALGAIWIPGNASYTREFLAKMKEIADYPILVMTDAIDMMGVCKVRCSRQQGYGDWPHIPRYIMDDAYEGSVSACLDVLAGNLETKGKLTYDVTLN